MKKHRFLSILILSAALVSPAFAGSPATRPDTWAVAVAAQGVGNLWRVEPDLYRSARPESAGFRELEKLGVKAVLDVESPADEAAARGTKLKLYHVPMTAFGLRDDRVLEAMRILSDPANRPIVIHCHLGADRTGALMALYRVVVEGWSKADAIREMNEGGYHHSSFWKNLDQYVAAVDVDALRRQLGIVKPSTTLLAALAKAPAEAATVVAKAIVPAVGTATSSVESMPVQTASVATAATGSDAKADLTAPASTEASKASASPAMTGSASGNQR